MQTIVTIDIAADPTAVYLLAGDIRHWPAFLPHYRWVTVLAEQADGTLVEMAAKRGWIPVRWQAVQSCDAAHRRICYRHTGGPTRGMRVVWEMLPTDAGTHVRLIHDLTLEHPLVRGWLGQRIVGQFFVRYIAGRTLRTMKTHLEKETPCVGPLSPASDR